MRGSGFWVWNRCWIKTSAVNTLLHCVPRWTGRLSSHWATPASDLRPAHTVYQDQTDNQGSIGWGGGGLARNVSASWNYLALRWN